MKNNIIKYVKENLNTFEKLPINHVDALIFTWLSYIRWPTHYKDIINSEICIKDLLHLEIFDEIFSQTFDKESLEQLFMYMVASPRYRDLYIKNYVDIFDEEKEKQFCAITFTYKNIFDFISFRGTDATIIGWKEDFNMVFKSPVPSQKEAAIYLKKASLLSNNPLYIGGHSKGGNLAIYASLMNYNLIDRIKHIYSFDGPGFLDEYINKEHYQIISSKIIKIVPKASIVGMLMESSNNYKIVNSDGISIYQHNPLTWEIINNDFNYLSSLDKPSISFKNHLNAYLKTISEEEREKFIETLYSLLEDVNATTTYDINHSWMVNYPKIMKSYKNIDDETKQFLNEIIKNFISLSIKR